MPLAGYLSARGELAFWPAVLAGSLGSLAGAAFWYWVGLRVTHRQLDRWVDAHGTWLAMAPGDVEWFRGHGRYSVLLGRLMPLVRTLISVPAGFSRMPFPRFLALRGGHPDLDGCARLRGGASSGSSSRRSIATSGRCRGS